MRMEGDIGWAAFPSVGFPFRRGCNSQILTTHAIPALCAKTWGLSVQKALAQSALISAFFQILGVWGRGGSLRDSIKQVVLKLD
jgi:hypothetical protein